MSWSAYMKKRGMLNLGVRMELGFATLATIINNALGGRAKLQDYMPFAMTEDDEGDATLDDLMGILMGARR